MIFSFFASSLLGYPAQRAASSALSPPGLYSAGKRRLDWHVKEFEHAGDGRGLVPPILLGQTLYNQRNVFLLGVNNVQCTRTICLDNVPKDRVP
jgi:hypothetical protein